MGPIAPIGGAGRLGRQTPGVQDFGRRWTPGSGSLEATGERNVLSAPREARLRTLIRNGSDQGQPPVQPWTHQLYALSQIRQVTGIWGSQPEMQL